MAPAPVAQPERPHPASPLGPGGLRGKQDQLPQRRRLGAWGPGQLPWDDLSGASWAVEMRCLGGIPATALPVSFLALSHQCAAAEHRLWLPEVVGAPSWRPSSLQLAWTHGSLSPGLGNKRWGWEVGGVVPNRQTDRRTEPRWPPSLVTVSTFHI